MTEDHWFVDVADTLGTQYLRYSFTRGTAQEVDFLIDELGLSPSDRILDVGCGPGRHVHELARRGFTVHGIDISPRFVELARDGAPDGATFEVADAATWTSAQPFDVVLSLCQGAFGLASGPGASSIDADADVLAAMVANLRPGGRLALSAFSAYFQVNNLAESDDFDADAGVNHEHTSVKDELGDDHPAELWTTCFTPRELRLMARLAGLDLTAVYSVRPGRYERARPSLDTEEFLLVATRPG